VLHVLETTIGALEQHEIPEPEASVFHLLSAALGLSWETGYRELSALWEGRHRLLRRSENAFQSQHHHDALSNRTLTSDEAQVFAGLVRRRLHHEPIQYLVGQWDFLDYVFRIRPPLLCPRPETEELVLLVEEDIRNGAVVVGTRDTSDDAPATAIRILDVGCGTGCIGISLLERLTSSSKSSSDGGSSIVQVEAIDIEPVAVDASLENARRILDDKQVLIKTNNSSQLASLESPTSYYTPCHLPLCEYEPTHRFHCVVSNPPYVPWTDRDTLDENVLNYESPEALFGGDDGMDVIRHLIRRLPGWCHDDAVCWLEVDPSHPSLLKSWIEQQEPSIRSAVELESTHRDSFGLERFVRLRVNPRKSE
jgi:release factor glutamine methyltransferase